MNEILLFDKIDTCVGNIKEKEAEIDIAFIAIDNCKKVIYENVVELQNLYRRLRIEHLKKKENEQT